MLLMVLLPDDNCRLVGIVGRALTVGCFARPPRLGRDKDCAADSSSLGRSSSSANGFFTVRMAGGA